MASVQKLPNGSFRAIWFLRTDDGRRIQRSRVFVLAREAKAHAAKMADEVEGLGIGDPDAQTFSQFARKWIAGLKARDELSPATLSNYEKNIDRLIALIGAAKLAQVRPGDLDDAYTAMLRSGGRGGAPLAAESVRLCHNVAHIVFEAARKRKLIRENPARDATPPKLTAKRKVRPFTDNEVGRMLELAVPERIDGSIYTSIDLVVMLLMASGIRRSELLGLAWPGVDLDAGSITISQTVVTDIHNAPVLREATKTSGSARTISLPVVVVERLRRHQVAQKEWMLMWGKEYDRSLQLVFPAPSGEPLAPNSLTKMIVRLMARAKVDKGVQPVHGFRHASATSLLSAGHNAVAVSKRLGHSKVSTTLDVYGHAAAGEDRAASDHFGARLAAFVRPKK